jgi:serine beta-lactamase-like protein LACTB, mitochondrial
VTRDEPRSAVRATHWHRQARHSLRGLTPAFGLTRMRAPLRSLPCFVLVAALAAQACTFRVFAVPSVAAEKLDGAIAQARTLVEKELAAKVPGMSVAVAVNGEIVWSQGFGYADLKTRAPVTPATRFRVGSVSKPLTAAGLALLVERGRIDLDAPVQRYVPDFPKKGVLITTRQLAGHLGGIRHYKERESLLNEPFATVRAGLSIFENDPLEVAPGTKYIYSTYGWCLISAVRETGAQQEFVGFMEANVFAPLGMKDTRADRAGTTDPQRTTFYSTNSAGKFVVSPPVDSSYKWAGGGFLSTTEDLVRFGSAHLQPGFLKKETLRLLFTRQRTNNGKQIDYGVGWTIGTDDKGHEIFSHGGNSIGGTTILLIHPSSKTVVAMVCNLSQANFVKGPAKPIAEMFSPVFAATKGR